MGDDDLSDSPGAGRGSYGGERAGRASLRRLGLLRGAPRPSPSLPWHHDLFAYGAWESGRIGSNPLLVHPESGLELVGYVYDDPGCAETCEINGEHAVCHLPAGHETPHVGFVAAAPVDFEWRWGSIRQARSCRTPGVRSGSETTAK